MKTLIMTLIMTLILISSVAMAGDYVTSVDESYTSQNGEIYACEGAFELCNKLTAHQCDDCVATMNLGSVTLAISPSIDLEYFSDDQELTICFGSGGCYRRTVKDLRRLLSSQTDP